MVCQKSRMKFRLPILFLLAAGLTLTGCFTKSSKAPLSLPAGPWALVEVNGRAVTVADPVQQPTLRFDAAAGRVSGHAGVNRLNGTFTQQDTELTFGLTATTKMAGPPELMKLEDTFLAMLPNVKSWRLDGTWLILLNQSGDVVARLVPGQNPQGG